MLAKAGGLAFLVVAGVAAAAPVDELASDDPRVVEAAVAAIEHAAADGDALLAAGRACEERLYDPRRAAADYLEVIRVWPGGRAGLAADHHYKRLARLLGVGDEFAPQTAAFEKLVGESDRMAWTAVLVEGEVLGKQRRWPGAPDVVLWLAEWLRARGHFDDAQREYAAVRQQWPDSSQAADAMRGQAGCALDAREWARAEAFARELPATDDVERALRDELLHRAAKGRARDAWYARAWVGLAVAFVLLVGSLVEAALRGGRRRPALAPPFEVRFLAPCAALLIAIAFVAQRAIAAAVVRITLVGLGLAWLSGAALDLARTRGRPVRARSIAHAAVCALGVVAIGYIAMSRDGLLDLLVETARSGPE